MILKRVHKLTLLSFFGPFLVTFFVCLFVLLMQFLFKYVEDMIGKGLEWHVIAELLLYASAHLVPLALPLAVLLSSLMTFGNLAERTELTAMKASGISLGKVMRPLLLLVFVLSCGAFYFSNTIIPEANLKFRALMWDVRQQKPAFDLQEGIFYDHLNGYSIWVKEKPDETTLRNVIIYDRTEGRGNTSVLRADAGQMSITDNERWMILTLRDGVRYEEMEEDDYQKRTYPHSQVYFDKHQLTFDLSEFQLDRTDESLFSHHYEMLNVFELATASDSMQKELDEKAEQIRSQAKRHISFFEKPISMGGPAGNDTSPAQDSSKNPFDNWKSNDTIPGEAFKNALDNARDIQEAARRHSEDVAHIQERQIRYDLEWHRRYTLSLAVFMLFLIGAPLGAIVGKGGLGMPTVLAVILFIIFHILMSGYERMAREAVISPFWGMWAPIFVIFPVGLLLTWQASRDSPLFHKELYSGFLRKIGILRKVKEKDENSTSDQ